MSEEVIRQQLYDSFKNRAILYHLILDELRGEVIEAFVVLRPGVAPTDELATALQQHVKQRYAAHAYPRSVHFLSELPKTPSGKVQRFVLRRQRQE